MYEPSSASSRGVSPWTIYPTVTVQVDGRIKGLDLSLVQGKKGCMDVERNPQLSRDCLLSSISLPVMEFISICTENYSSAVVRSEETRTVPSTTNVKQRSPKSDLRFSQPFYIVKHNACFMLVCCFAFSLILMVEAKSSSKTSADFQRTTSYIPE